MSWLAPIAGAAGSILGGIFGRSKTESAEAQSKRTRLDSAAGVLGRIDAAKAAGISPLAALGASVSGGSPASTVGGDFSGLGDVGRQIQAVRDAKEQQRQFNEQSRQNQIDKNREILMQKDRDALNAMQVGASVDLARAQALESEQNAAAIKLRSQQDSADWLKRQMQSSVVRRSTSAPQKVGSAEILDAQIPVRDPNGNITYVDNPKLGGQPAFYHTYAWDLERLFQGLHLKNPFSLSPSLRGDKRRGTRSQFLNPAHRPGAGGN